MEAFYQLSHDQIWEKVLLSLLFYFISTKYLSTKKYKIMYRQYIRNRDSMDLKHKVSQMVLCTYGYIFFTEVGTKKFFWRILGSLGWAIWKVGVTNAHIFSHKSNSSTRVAMTKWPSSAEYRNKLVNLWFFIEEHPWGSVFTCEIY